MSNGNSDNPMLRIGGLWENKSKNGKRFLSGRWGALKLIAFENSQKRSENAPDWDLFITEAPQERQQQQGQGQPPRRPEPAPRARPARSDSG